MRANVRVARARRRLVILLGRHALPPPTRLGSIWPIGGVRATTLAELGAREPCNFPLDGGRRLRGDVQRDAVDPRDLVDDPARDRLQQVVGQARPVGGHRILRGDRADDDRVRVRPLVALHAHGADPGQHREALPQVAVQPGAADLFLEDRVRLAQDLEPLVRDLADDPDGEAGAGERLPPDHSLGEPELGADTAHLVLEEQAQRLDELHLHVLGQPADVVVRLDDGRVLAPARLDHVGIERPLDEVPDLAELPRLLLEDADELLADPAALFLRVGHAVEPCEEALLRVDVDERDVEVSAERLDHLRSPRPSAAGHGRRRRR